MSTRPSAKARLPVSSGEDEAPHGELSSTGTITLGQETPMAGERGRDAAHVGSLRWARIGIRDLRDAADGDGG